MADELGVEVVVTDYSADNSIPIEESTVIRRHCLMHVKRPLGRAKGRLAGDIRNRYGEVLDQVSETVRELPPDGANKLIRWSRDRRLPLKLRRSGVPNSTNWVEEPALNSIQ